MPKPQKNPVPKSLQFLEPFITFLNSLPDDELNEDVDADLLDQLLRERVEGMSADQANAEIVAIRKSVEAWIADSPVDNGPANWLLGCLMLPGLGRELTQPPQPDDPDPCIRFDTPEGWKEERSDSNLGLKSGRVFADITVDDEFAFNHQIEQFKQWAAPPDLKATLTKTEVSLGPCHGYKYVYLQEGARNEKAVTYLLAVPGGFVHVSIGTVSGKDFDESPIENRLHTLSIENGG